MRLADAAAAYRLTRLATADVLTAGPRDAVVRWAYVRAGKDWRLPLGAPEEGDWAEMAMADPDAPKLATLVTCSYCASVWIACGVVLVRRFRWWRYARDVLALSSVAVFLKRLEP